MCAFYTREVMFAFIAKKHCHNMSRGPLELCTKASKSENHCKMALHDNNDWLKVGVIINTSRLYSPTPCFIF